MEKIRICIGSNDKNNIARSHMGDTELFYVFDLFRDKDAILIEIRNNDARGLDHSSSDKMAYILKILNDVEVLTAWQKSPNFINIAKKSRHQPVIVKVEKIEDVLKSLQNSFTQLAGLVENRKKGTFTEDIPEYIQP